MASNSKHAICVIIPVHNEQAVVSRCAKLVIAELKKITYKTQLIIVDDGSADKTPILLKKLKRQYKSQLRVVTHSKNKGYGAALQQGIREGLRQKFEFGIFMDADLTNDPHFLHMFAALAPQKLDCVKASRYIHGGGMVGVPFKRRLFSALGNLFAMLTFDIGIRDCTNGFRMVRLSKLRGVKFHESGFPIILEELYYLKKRHAKFIEIPNVLTNRKQGKTHFQYNSKTIGAYAKYALKAAFLLS